LTTRTSITSPKGGGSSVAAGACWAKVEKGRLSAAQRARAKFFIGAISMESIRKQVSKARESFQSTRI